MRVRRGSSSPPLLLDNGKAEPPTSVNGSTNYYQFELEDYHVERGKRGQKVFSCDICPSGVFKRSFSLKRHYLRFHINFAFLSPRDLNNCAIAVAGQHQRSGGALLGDHGSATGMPLLFRCHQCGYLMRSKEELLKHLDTHPSEADAAELLKGDQRSNNRCPRCSTAFTLRKTLIRHIKKNRCRGGAQPAHQTPEAMVKSDPESGAQSAEEQSSTTSFVHEIHLVHEDDIDEMDMETSLKPENAGSLFRYACTLCSKMFSSYINMCRHRRLAHGRYGMCSSNWLQSRKSSAKKSLSSSQSVHSNAIPPHSFARRTFTFHNYSHFVRNADDNLQRFLHGKKNHIKSLVNTEDTVEEGKADEAEVSNRQELTERWSWGEEGCSIQEVHRLDVPLQQAFRHSLEVSKATDLTGKEKEVQEEEETSHSVAEAIDVLTLLSLRLATSSSLQSKEQAVSTVQRPELSGEWTRKKSYICSPCGQMFKDFLTLLDHQYINHASVNCTHVQLDQSMEEEVADELTEQITRSGNGPADPPAVLQCTKCQFVVESIAELHSHILLCSNHVSASPYKKQRRNKVSSSSKRDKSWGVLKCASVRSRGMQRSFSETKNSSTSIPRSLRSRSPKDGSRQEIISNGVLKRNARRVLNFNDSYPIRKKKKKDAGVKRILRQRVDIRQVSQPIQTTIKTMIKKEVIKKKKGAASFPVETSSDLQRHECDACLKQFKSNTSVLKHKHYCPNRKIEPDQPIKTVSPSTSLPSVSEKSKTTNSKKAKFDKTSKNSVAKQTRSNSTVRSSSPPGPISSSKQSINTLSSRGTDILSTKKNAKKPQPTLKEKTSKKKVKSAQIDYNKRKKAIKIQHVSSDEESSGKEMTPARPVRLSRKSSNLNMEDQVEASFLEALSPEQRIRVGEQKCPFCNKHYVYRSNFKKHLVEGCDTVDVEEETLSSSKVSLKAKSPSLPSVVLVESKRNSVGVKRSADASQSSSKKETQKKILKVDVSTPGKQLLRKSEKKVIKKEKFNKTPVPLEKPDNLKKLQSPLVLEKPGSKKKLKPVVVKEEKTKSDEGIKNNKKSAKDVKNRKGAPKSIKLSIRAPLVGASKTQKSKTQFIKVSKKKSILVSKPALNSKKNLGKEPSATKAKKNVVKSGNLLKKKKTPNVPTITTQREFEKNINSVLIKESPKMSDQVFESVIKGKLQIDLTLSESDKIKNQFLPVALHQVVREEEHLSADTAESLPGNSATNPSSDHVESHPCAKENGTEQLTATSCNNLIAMEKEDTGVGRLSDALDALAQPVEMVSPVVRQVLDVMEQQEHLKADIAESVPESKTPEECSNLESVRTTFTVETGIETRRVGEENQVANNQDSDQREENDYVGSSGDELVIHKPQTEAEKSNSSTASRSSNNEMEVNSHALDRLLLGQALNDAIQKGILKPYSNLTKIPLRIRQLKVLFESSQASTSRNGHHQK